MRLVMEWSFNNDLHLISSSIEETDHRQPVNETGLFVFMRVMSLAWCSG